MSLREVVASYPPCEPEKPKCPEILFTPTTSTPLPLGLYDQDKLKQAKLEFLLPQSQTTITTPQTQDPQCLAEYQTIVLKCIMKLKWRILTVGSGTFQKTIFYYLLKLLKEDPSLEEVILPFVGLAVTVATATLTMCRCLSNYPSVFSKMTKLLTMKPRLSLEIIRHALNNRLLPVGLFYLLVTKTDDTLLTNLTTHGQLNEKANILFITYLTLYRNSPLDNQLIEMFKE